MLNIIIWRDLFEDIFYNLLRKSNAISDFFNQSLYLYEQNDYMIIDTEKDEDISSFVLDMYIQGVDQKPFYNLVSNAEIMYIIALILQRYDKNIHLPEKPYEGNDTIIQMISYIEHHFKDVTLNSLSDHFGFSANYCSRMIKKYTGKSFTDIVLNIKFTKAKNMLDMGEKSIADIAENTGFNNIEHFNRLFKKRYHMTPGAYKSKSINTYFQE